MFEGRSKRHYFWGFAVVILLSLFSACDYFNPPGNQSTNNANTASNANSGSGIKNSNKPANSVINNNSENESNSSINDGEQNSILKKTVEAGKTKECNPTTTGPKCKKFTKLLEILEKFPKEITENKEQYEECFQKFNRSQPSNSNNTKNQNQDFSPFALEVADCLIEKKLLLVNAEGTSNPPANANTAPSNDEVIKKLSNIESKIGDINANISEIGTKINSDPQTYNYMPWHIAQLAICVLLLICSGILWRNTKLIEKGQKAQSERTKPTEEIVSTINGNILKIPELLNVHTNSISALIANINSPEDKDQHGGDNSSVEDQQTDVVIGDSDRSSYGYQEGRMHSFEENLPNLKSSYNFPNTVRDILTRTTNKSVLVQNPFDRLALKDQTSDSETPYYYLISEQLGGKRVFYAIPRFEKIQKETEFSPYKGFYQTEGQTYNGEIEVIEPAEVVRDESIEGWRINRIGKIKFV